MTVHRTLADAGLKAKEVDEIVLVGGSTRIPWVQNVLEQELGRRTRRDVHPELAVAYGAGVIASRLMGTSHQRILVDITPYTFGTSCVRTCKDTCASIDLCRSLKPARRCRSAGRTAFLRCSTIKTRWTSTCFRVKVRMPVKIF